MKKVPVMYFYIVIIAGLLVQTFFTAYNQGTFLQTTESVHSLTQQKQIALKQQLELRNQLSQITSLRLVAQQAGNSDYQPITHPLIIATKTSNVALSEL